MDKIPLVSICIPTYNGASYIHEAMASAIAQTYPNLEIIVSDDLSQDHTLDIIESFKEKTNIPIKIYHHKPSGIGANWNHCIKNSNGEYIKFLFQDDVLYPNCIEEMVNTLKSNETLDMVACKRHILWEIDYNPKAVSAWLANCEDLQKGLDQTILDEVLIIDKKLFKSKQFLRSPLNKVGEPSCILFRKELIDGIGYFRTDLVQFLDFEFCYRILKRRNIGIIQKPLVKFRLHKNQATNKNYQSNDHAKYSKILYLEYLNYVDDYTRLHLLKKHNFFYKYFYKIKGRLKTINNFVFDKKN